MKRRAFWPFALAGVAVVASLGLALGSGPAGVGPTEAWALLLGGDGPATAKVIVWDLRLPRALLAALLGAGLGAAGAVTQGLCRNPLAEPSVLGVSMGAALCAVLGVFFHLDTHALWVTPLLAGAGAAGTLLLLFALAGRSRSVATLLLCGIAIGAMASALVTLLLAWQVERYELGLKVLAWLMGSFEARSWTHLGWALPPTLLGLLATIWLRKDLDLLHLGAETATSLGLDPKRLRLVAVGCVALLVGTATALVGVIGFLGLVVPHSARLLVGPSHGRLLPFSMLLGAVLLVLVDTLSRSVTDVLLPPGVITSLVGAPFFLFLLRRHGGLA